MKLKHSTYPAVLGVFAAAVVIGGPLTANAAVPEFQAQVVAPTMQTDRMIVKYKDSKPAGKAAARLAVVGKDREAILTRAGQQFGMTMKLSHGIATGAHVMKLNKRMDLAEVQKLARDLMERDPNVEYAEPDRIMQKLFTPNDTRYNEQWHYFEATGGLRVNTAWDKATGTGVNVAVIDTGYRPHADLSGKIVGGYDFIADTFISNDGNGRDSDASDPGDNIVVGECGGGQPTQNQNSSWHGTHVAGTIAAATNNGSGVAGVAYNAKVVPVRVLGKCGGYTSDIADAIIWASGGTVSGVPANANVAKVINMSLGGGGACDTTSQNAINSARSRGTVVIVAAGNENTNASNSNPANCAGVVTVAATNRSGGRAWYSNYGTVVDVAAPGGDTSVSANGILSTLNAGTGAPGADNYAFYQGTSMATPHVAGVAALMLSKNAALTPDQIESMLKSSARAFPATCTSCGSGIVDANAAVDAAIGGGGGTTLAESEANNTTATADAVTVSGTTVNANMGTTTDTDYFLVQLPAGKTLTSVLTPGAGKDYDLFVYNSTGALIGSSENGAGAVDTVAVTNTGTGTLARYVRVTYYSGGTGATNGTYTLKLTW
ncbi:S8 family serine peptidase [Massilia sp. RP-1-19]|uniref:S8 family serine peptidase n=1 Tax=Massilia polaris TaxID=2728846 RepID=A0A848HFI8_9BURK|nr:S8 family peptidase [Massilia polaris]NML60626.1 S8 family serine peptidase [Massilia polaris]